MAKKAQEDAVINLQSLRDLGKQLSFEWPMVAYELGFTRAEISHIHALTPEKRSQAQKMLEHWYEQSCNKLNRTKLLQEALEKSGRQDLAEKLRCLHWGHQKLSDKVELPSAFPFLITVYKTTNNKERLKKINQLTHRVNFCTFSMTFIEGKVFIMVQSKPGINNMATALERRLQFIEEESQTERWIWKKRE